MKQLKNVTLGADIEMFLVDKHSENLSLVPAYDVVSSTKENPESIGEGFKIHPDNVSLELICPPSGIINSESDVVNHLNNNFLGKKILEASIFPGVRPYHFDTFIISPDMLSDERLLEFGCDPEFDAWTGKEFPAANAQQLFRASGYHIHIGYDNPTDEVSREIVKYLDMSLLPQYVEDIYKNRELYQEHQAMIDRWGQYGKPGAHRIKPYGVEYRVFGGFLYAHQDLAANVYTQLYNSLYNFESGITYGNWDSKQLEYKLGADISTRGLRMFKHSIVYPEKASVEVKF